MQFINKVFIPFSFILLLSACGGSSGNADNSENITNNDVPTTVTNNTPVANAGEDQSVTLGSTVQLSASGSHDSDSDVLTYLWSINTSPDNSTATLSSVESEVTTLTMDTAGLYVISLVVNDGQIDSAEDDVTITVIENEDPPTNNPPIANAGNNQTVTVGDYVQLSAINSFDADNDPLTYQWTITNKPQGSIASLINTTEIETQFNADITGEFEISLVANDGQSDSISDAVIISATNQLTNITNKTFTNIATSCLSYVGSYYANVSDIKRALTFDGDISFSSNSTHCILSSNAIPNHDFNDNSASFATNVAENSTNFEFPLTPKHALSETYLSIGTTEGVLLNGVTLDLLPAACFGVGNESLGNEKIGCGPEENNHPWRYDPMSTLNSFGTDQHNAHTQPSGKYHYHGNPVAMFSQECTDEASSVIGFAADGYPIFGSCFEDSQSGEVRKASSSYQLKNQGGVRQDVTGYQTPQAGVGGIVSSNYDGQFRGDWEYIDGAGDLDQCNGMTINGQYGYYVTDTFPWVLNCFRGTVDSSFSAGPNNAARRMHSHEDNTFHSH